MQSSRASQASRGQAPSGSPWYTHRWPWFLMLGPALVVVAGAYTMWLAVTRQDALVADDYYKQGQAINKDLRRDRMATALGMSAQLGFDAAAGRLQGHVLASGQPLRGKVMVTLTHPTQPAKDLRLLADPDETGAFVVALPMLERTHWQVAVEGRDAERHGWRLLGTWDWPRTRSINLKADAPAAGMAH